MIRTSRRAAGEPIATSKKPPAIIEMCITTMREYGWPMSLSGLAEANSRL